MQRFSDSDTGTQMIKGPFRRRWRQLPFAGTPYYTVRRTGYFYSTIRATQNSRLEAVSVQNRWKGCQMQGGRRRRSGATLTDDDAVDDGHAGEAGEISHRPWVLIYTFNFKSI